MKTYNPLFAAVILSFLVATATTQTTSPSLTLVTTTALKGATFVKFLPQGETEISFWDQNYAKIEIAITGQGFTRAQLKALIPIGVFNLNTTIDNTTATLAMPGLDKFITVRGKEFAPSLSFNIILPHGVQLERPVENLTEEILVEVH